MDYYLNMYIITLYEQKNSMLIFAFPPHYQVVSISIRLSLFSRVRCKLIKHLSETSQAYTERQETKYSDKRIRKLHLKQDASTPSYHDLITHNKPCQRHPTSQNCPIMTLCRMCVGKVIFSSSKLLQMNFLKIKRINKVSLLSQE